MPKRHGTIQQNSAQQIAAREPESLPNSGAALRSGETPLSADSADARSERKAVSPDDDATRLVEAEAYELYCQRGCVDGGDVDDWLEAERRVRGRQNPERA